MIVGLLVLLIVVLTVLVVVFACKRIKDAERKKEAKDKMQVYEDDESKRADKNTAVKEPQEPPESTPAKHSFL